MTRPSLWPRIEPLLAQVEKPARYIGGELGASSRSTSQACVSWLLVYPDTYEIGLPNQGLQILYEILNERPDAVAERAYAPWFDMEAQMRRERRSRSSRWRATVPARSFDVIAFNWAAELTATNILNLVDLVRSAGPVGDRGRRTIRLVLVGGHCAFNPEPMADFVDAFVLGDGEEVVGELCDVICWPSARRTGLLESRACSRQLATIPGVYVPALYESSRHRRDASTRCARTAAGAPEHRREADSRRPGPMAISESTAGSADRGRARPAERGDLQGLHAGLPVLPGRDDHASGARAAARAGRADGRGRPRPHGIRRGCAHFPFECGLLRHRAGSSPMSSTAGTRRCGRVSVSLPSLRVDAFTVGLASEIQRVKRTGLTFAPEGGTWRMRQVINKLIREEDLYAAVDAAFSQGWRRVKLYFLIGLPTETDDDVLGIVQTGRHVRRDRQALPEDRSRSPLRSVGSSRRPTPRSSGSARTPRPSCVAR